MKRYIFAHPKLFAAILVLGVLAQGMATSISFFTMFVIDSIASGEMANLVTATYVSIAAIILFYVFMWAYTKATAYYSYKTTLKLKSDVFSAILTKRIADFNQANSAKYISLINNDLQMIYGKYINGILEVAKFIVTIIFAVVAMFFLSPVNAIIAIVLSSTPMVLPLLFGKKLAKTNMVHMEKLAVLNEKVKDFLMGFEVIKTFGIEKNIGGKFAEATQDAESARYIAGKVNMQMGALSATFMIATSILTFLVAGYFVITGHITIGAVIAISGLAGSVIGPMQYLAISVASIKSTKDVRDNVLAIMQPAATLPQENTADFSHGIILDDVSFGYALPTPSKPEQNHKKPQIKMIQTNGKSLDEILADLGIDAKDATILDGTKMSTDAISNVMKQPSIQKTNLAIKNISYTFKPNGKYAIVGGSGSGKSTLLRAIAGYFDNYQGKISVGGCEIRDINRDSLYQQLALMHQNVFLLDDTLRNNITLYNAYSNADYNSVIGRAQLTGLVDSTTNVGEGGKLLSGGERQRIAIARALIKGSRVIMLDEATANLDNETAYSIEKSLIEASDLTCIFVTHRYTRNLLEKCDGILVMRDGELVESGTFAELYDKKDYFYSLFKISGS